MPFNICLMCLLPMAYHTSAGCPGKTKPTWICGKCGFQLDAPQAPHWCPPSNITVETYPITKQFWTSGTSE